MSCISGLLGQPKDGSRTQRWCELNTTLEFIRDQDLGSRDERVLLHCARPVEAAPAAANLT
jgi:hypothetical protein